MVSYHQASSTINSTLCNRLYITEVQNLKIRPSGKEYPYTFHHYVFVGQSENEVSQSCPTLFNPMDCSLPGSSVHGIFQAIVLEWIAISFSKEIFPTQGSNLGLLHCRQTLYHLSHQVFFYSLVKW